MEIKSEKIIKPAKRKLFRFYWDYLHNYQRTKRVFSLYIFHESAYGIFLVPVLPWRVLVFYRYVFWLIQNPDFSLFRAPLQTLDVFFWDCRRSCDWSQYSHRPRRVRIPMQNHTEVFWVLFSSHLLVSLVFSESLDWWYDFSYLWCDNNINTLLLVLYAKVRKVKYFISVSLHYSEKTILFTCGQSSPGTT